MPSPEAPASNFAFLAAEWKDFYVRALAVERRVFFDPRAACVEGRITLEEIVRWLYEVNSDLREPYRNDLAARIAEPTFTALVGPAIQQKADVIRKVGNQAAHDGRVRVGDRASLTVARELFHVLFWIANAYSKDRAPLEGLAFDASLIRRPLTPEQRAQAQQDSLAKLREAEAKQRARDEELQRLRDESAARQAELEQIQAQLAAAKAANEQREVRHDYDEAATRDAKIDVLLVEAGWDPAAPNATEFEVDGMPRQRGDGTGKGFVDYVLWGEDGRPLGLIEAKRTRRDATEGREQAKHYADRLEAQFGQRPVIFYSNGYEHWIWDDAAYAPRPVAGFYTQGELATLVGRRTSRLPLGGVEIKAEIVGRDYQQRAIRSICDAFESQQRGGLLVMATGSGKTRTVIALVDLLMRAGLVKRTLFLADRQALVKQAANAFKAHLPEVATVNLLDTRDEQQEGRVYVSTYPTIMNRIAAGPAAKDGRFGPGFFDLVIVDEAHRSVYQKYGAIFDYFDSLLVGLTATPRGEVHRDTYRVFGLEAGVPTDHYGLEEAVDQGHLVPPRGIDVPLKFPRLGARYADLTDDEREQWDALEWDDDGGIPDLVTAAEVNAKFFNVETVDKALQVLMERGLRVAGGDRLGKTIIFAKNQAHAEFISKRFDHNYPEYKGSFARVITHGVEHAQSLIDQFSQPDQPPHIAISVDMLDTGIDVPEVLNLMFFKVVRSSTKFWQMVGRGTRLRKDLFGPGEDKEFFFVFDVCNNFEYFSLELKAPDTTLARPLRQRIFDTRVDLLELFDRAADAQPPDAIKVRAAVADRLHQEVASMTRENFLVRPHLRTVEQYTERAAWDEIGADDALDLKEQLAPLPTGVLDRDEAAKRFDLLMLHLERGTFQPEPADAKRQEQVQHIAAALLEQTNVPKIQKQVETLTSLASEEWWDGVTLAMLEQARVRVRELAALVQASKRAVVYTDFVDDLGEVKEIDMPGLPGISDFARFEEKARAFLREHSSNLTLIKLRRNEPLTAVDLEQLTELLLQSGVGTRADIARAEEASRGLGLFIRGLVGVDRVAARAAVDQFIAGRQLTANQLRFLDEIVQHLTRNGHVDRGALFDSPFSELAPEGPDELFDEAEIIDLYATLDRVRANAVGERAAGGAA